MKNKIYFILLTSYFLLPYSVSCFPSPDSCLLSPDKPKHFFFSGYLSTLYIPSYSFSTKDFNNLGMIHNRLNFKYTPTDNWELAAELRTRAMFQDFRGYSKEMFKATTQDAGWLNLGWNIVRSKYFLLTTSIERLYVSYQTDRWGFKVGRQRINWSQALFFNPNDIFNGYSFFDYDYPERQGSDAIRISAYPTATSVVELAAKLNYWGQPTIAGVYRFNTNGWDIQVLGGMVNRNDLTLGVGFSGDIKGVNLRGEFSYYYSLLPNSEFRNSYVATLGTDYIFSNGIMLSFSALYNRLPKDSLHSFVKLLSAPMSPKVLSITEWTITGQISYTFSPILSGGMAVLCFANLPAFYLGPNIDWSITKSLTLSAMIQEFIGTKKLAPSDLLVGYLRVRWDF